MVSNNNESRIVYSDHYADDTYEYRHVILPPELAAKIPQSHLLTETEWRNLGLQQSTGWVHYMMHKPGLYRMTEKSHENVIYAMVGNIPLEFHTPDLRNFFSYSIEKEFFICFNYRHRPHHTRKFNTCVCKVKPNRFDELHKLYDKKNWIDQRGRLNSLKCSIVKIKVNKIGAASTENKLTREELDNLLEFARIPAWMPEGNVGTPTKTFVGYINRCAMPQSLISKIGVNLKTFKKHRKRAYANVEYKYEGDEEEESDDSEVTHVDVVSTANGHRIVDEIDDEREIREKNYSNEKKAVVNVVESVQLKEADDDNDDELEDWERHESLHDDVTKQDRTSPYFFENEIELQWEKGGSGLVFYTDDNFWKDLENKDFDAETADDLDVDTSVYYDANSGDKDARDLVDMRRMEMMRSGAPPELFDDLKLKSHKTINPFHNRPEFGRKQLEKLGWKPGDPVGDPIRSGLREPLDASDGKHPLDKTGLGYHGEKVDREAMIEEQKKRRERERRSAPYFIGSKYDSDVSRPHSLLRRVDPQMKYRSNESA